jgi:hypothetical protein
VGPVLASFLACLCLALISCSGKGDSARSMERRLDSERLAELELTYEIPAQVRQACAEARRQAQVRVVCPRLIPDVPLTRSAGLWGAIIPPDEPRFYMLTFNNGGLPGGKRHWITGGGEAGAVQKWVLTDFQNVVKGDPKLVRTLSRSGRRVSIYHFPPYPAGGPNGGHWAAFIKVGDEIVFASPHERRYIDAAIEMALALADDLEAAGEQKCAVSSYCVKRRA